MIDEQLATSSAALNQQLDQVQQQLQNIKAHQNFFVVEPSVFHWTDLRLWVLLSLLLAIFFILLYISRWLRKNSLEVSTSQVRIHKQSAEQDEVQLARLMSATSPRSKRNHHVDRKKKI